MRLIVLPALATSAFVASITLDSTDANAVVCARGVVRAGCVGPWCRSCPSPGRRLPLCCT
jgi:hypothetical protein